MPLHQTWYKVPSMQSGSFQCSHGANIVGGMQKGAGDNIYAKRLHGRDDFILAWAWSSLKARVRTGWGPDWKAMVQTVRLMMATKKVWVSNCILKFMGKFLNCWKMWGLAFVDCSASCFFHYLLLFQSIFTSFFLSTLFLFFFLLVLFPLHVLCVTCYNQIVT